MRILTNGRNSPFYSSRRIRVGPRQESVSPSFFNRGKGQNAVSNDSLPGVVDREVFGMMTEGESHEYRSFEPGRELFQDRDDDIHIIPPGEVAEDDSGGAVKNVQITKLGKFLTQFVGLA